MDRLEACTLGEKTVASCLGRGEAQPFVKLTRLCVRVDYFERDSSGVACLREGKDFLQHLRANSLASLRLGHCDGSDPDIILPDPVILQGVCDPSIGCGEGAELFPEDGPPAAEERPTRRGIDDGLTIPSMPRRTRVARWCFSQTATATR